MRVPISAALMVIATVSLSSCAAHKRFVHSPVPPGQTAIPATGTTFELVSDGSGGCRKQSGPYVFYARADQWAQWTVTNNCGQPATVVIEKFKLKHKFLSNGTFPFRREGLRLSSPVGSSETVVLRGQVLNSATEDERGFNVFKYEVRIISAEKVNKEDPEIIVEWP